MTNNTNLEKYLSTATAGLEGDRELRLDVQAELRTHLEARLRDAQADGLTGPAAEEQALKTMGSALDLAGELAAANRRRMKLRAVIRNFARWCLVPAAVVVACLCMPYENGRLLNRLKSDLELHRVETLTPPPFSTISETNKLILSGDQTRTGRAAQQRAIWERWPDDKVYLHNYLTYLAAEDHTTSSEAAFAAFSAEIAKLQPLDPDNARFEYLLAGKLLEQAGEFKSEPVKNPPPGGKSHQAMFVIKDRQKLDRAMALLKTALAKPFFRTHTPEMTKRRDAMFRPPTTMAENLYQLYRYAGISLPDIVPHLSLAKASVYYGERLAAEGRLAEAGVYLDAYKTMIAQMNRDSFTLIEQLVIGAMAGFAAERVPPIYEQMGQPEKAAMAKAEAVALQAPAKEFKDRRKNRNNSELVLIKEHGALLAFFMLPSLGELVSIGDLAPGRELDFVIAEQFAMAGVSVLLFGCMMACLAATLYRRFRHRGAPPLLLLPTLAGTLRIIGFGILLPLLAYYLLTRYLPGAGRDFSIVLAFPKLAAELCFLLLAMFWITTSLAERQVRRRCRELDLPVPPPLRTTGWLVAEAALFAAFLLACVFSFPGTTDSRSAMVLAGGLAAAAVLLECTREIMSQRQERKSREQCRLYYGTRTRSLIPVCALAMILLSVASSPFLRFEERRLVREDNVCGLDADGGFTIVEARVTKRLRDGVQAALDNINRNPREPAAGKAKP